MDDPCGALRGGCFCGAVRYEADAAVDHETLCHCSICRRTSGAPMVAWFSVPRSALVFTAGTPVYFSSSDHGTRGFCSRCGTPLTFASTHLPNELDVTTCSLDAPERVPPRDHTQTSAQLPWLALGDALPRYPGYRFEGLGEAASGPSSSTTPGRSADGAGPRTGGRG